MLVVALLALLVGHCKVASQGLHASPDQLGAGELSAVDALAQFQVRSRGSWRACARCQCR